MDRVYRERTFSPGTFLRTQQWLSGAMLVIVSSTRIQSQQVQGALSVTGGSATAVLGMTSRTMNGLLFGSNVRVSGADGETLIAGLREEHGTIDSIGTVDRSASLTVLNGRITLGGSFGVHSELGAHSGFGSGALSIAV